MFISRILEILFLPPGWGGNKKQNTPSFAYLYTFLT